MWKNVRLLFSKELLGAVRDRRTLFMTVIFPLVFYPILLSVMGRFNEAEQLRLDAMVPAVAVLDRSADETFEAERLRERSIYWIPVADESEGLDALADDVGHVFMAVDKETGGEGIGLSVTLHYDQADQFAVVAAARVREFLEEYLKRVVNDKLEAMGMLEEVQAATPPLSVDVVNVATGESLGRMIMSRLLPYFMVLAILTGAMGLGAEITAGEKERSTIATLLVSQLSRTEIVLGKFFTVMTVSLVSALLSAVGLLMGVRFFGGGLTPVGAAGGAVFQLDLSAFGWLLVILVPLAVILAALVIIVGTFARSQKEASVFLLPIYMVIVLVGMTSMTGGVTFEGLRFLIPVANALYALQAVILGDLVFSHLLYTLIANVVCGLLLIAAAVQLFKREAVLFRS